MHFRTLFATFWDYIGDLGGFLAAFAHLFQIIPSRHPLSNRLKVGFLDVLDQTRNWPILRQEFHPGRSRARTGPRAASRVSESEESDPSSGQKVKKVRNLTRL